MSLLARKQGDAFLPRLEEFLAEALSGDGHWHPALREAMVHALLGGGKRLRPQLLAAAMRLGRYDEDTAIRAGAALEMLHTYSLIHDDLPAMDDDDFRRGRPTCHRIYGEAMAILAGDALQALAIETLIRVVAAAELDKTSSLALLGEFATTAGPAGLVGGQAGDLDPLELEAREQVDWIHARKTAALIRCSIVTGAHLGGAPATEIEALSQAGLQLGLAFQAVDDLLDEEASRAELGKTPGKDRVLGKRTLTALLGKEETRRIAEERLAQALALIPEREEASMLRDIARRLVHRRF